jgi:hypothetical protein
MDADEYVKVFRAGILLGEALLALQDVYDKLRDIYSELEAQKELHKKLEDVLCRDLDLVEAHVRDAWDEIADLARSIKFE